MGESIEIIETKLYAGMVADEIVASINDAIAESGCCRIALAGGKTPSVIYRAIAKPPRVNEVEWDKVQIFWSDERWVPKSDTQSNFKMAHETLLAFLPQPKPLVCPVDTSLTTPQEGAAAYEALMRETFKVAAPEIPVFDMILLGMGEDGHTASIFPNSPLLTADDRESLCRAVPFPYEEGYRVSLTPAVIKRASKLLFIVRGEGKAAITKKVLEGAFDPVSTPSQLYREAGGRVSFFLDSAAAQQLSKAKAL